MYLQQHVYPGTVDLQTLSDRRIPEVMTDNFNLILLLDIVFSLGRNSRLQSRHSSVSSDDNHLRFNVPYNYPAIYRDVHDAPGLADENPS